MDKGFKKFLLSISLSSNFQPKYPLVLWVVPICCKPSYDADGITILPSNTVEGIGFITALKPLGDILGDKALDDTAKFIYSH